MIEDECNIANLAGYDHVSILCTNQAFKVVYIQAEHQEDHDECWALKKEFKDNIEVCRNDDTIAQCDCWIKESALVDQIKSLKCKAKEKQLKVTAHKASNLQNSKLN